MSITDYVQITVLGLFAATALSAGVLVGYSVIQALRGTHLASRWPVPRLALTPKGRKALLSLPMWLGILATSISLPVILVLVISAATTPSFEVQTFHTYFSAPGGNSVLVSVARGAEQCEADAAVYARAHDLFESEWSYECRPVSDPRRSR